MHVRNNRYCWYYSVPGYVHLDVLAVETNLLQLQVFAGRPVISSRTICTEDCIFRAGSGGRTESSVPSVQDMLLIAVPQIPQDIKSWTET